MLSFLAQVQVINAAGTAKTDADTSIRPDAHAQVNDAINSVRVITDAVLDVARFAANETVTSRHLSVSTSVDQSRSEAAKTHSDADDDHDDEGSSDVTINSGPHGVIIHKKSHDDIPSAVVPIVAIFFVFTYLIIKAVMAPFTNRNKRVVEVPVAGGLSEQEAVVLEKLQRTLAQMENRVESLETIIIDQSRTKEKYGTKL